MSDYEVPCHLKRCSNFIREEGVTWRECMNYIHYEGWLTPDDGRSWYCPEHRVYGVDTPTASRSPLQEENENLHKEARHLRVENAQLRKAVLDIVQIARPLNGAHPAGTDKENRDVRD